MKKLLLVAVVSASVALSGCQTFKDNPALGVALGVAGGAVAASIAAKHKDDKHEDGDDWRDSHGHKHHRRGENDYHPWDRDNHRDQGNVVYQDGRPGYTDAYGNFHAY